MKGDERAATGGSLARLVAILVAFAATYLWFMLSPSGQQLDISSFGAFSALHASLGPIVGLYREAAPFALGAVGLVLGIWALLKRRLADAVRAAGIVAVSVALAEVLKLLLPRGDYGVGGYLQNTFPSGHVALAVSVVLATAILLPGRRRRGVALLVLGLVAIGMAWASVISYAHRPSDTIGGALVVGIVATVSLWNRRTIIAVSPWSTIGLLVLLGAAVAVLVVPSVEDGPAIAGWLVLTAVPAVLVVLLAPTATRPGRVA